MHYGTNVVSKWGGAAALLLAMGCGQPGSTSPVDNSVCTNGKCDVVNPQDNDDQNLGKLIVNLPTIPAGAKATKSIVSEMTIDVTNGVTYGVVGSYKAGKHQILLNSTYDDHPLGHSIDITIEAKKTVTYALAGLYPIIDNSTLAVNFGPTAAPVLSGVALSAKADPGQYIPLFAGDYTLSYGVKALDNQDDITVKLSQGEYRELTINPPDRRATIILKAPQRTFPDPSPQFTDAPFGSSEECKTATHPSPEHLVDRPFYLTGNNINYESLWSAGSSDLNMYVWSDRTLKVFPFTSAEAPRHYELVVNNQSMELKVQAGETVTVPIKRIDVNDVELTLEDGTKRYQPGAYVIEKQGSHGEWQTLELHYDCFRILDPASGGIVAAVADRGMAAPMQPVETKTGMDVLPGIYRVIVTYMMQAEGLKTQTFDLDLTH